MCVVGGWAQSPTDMEPFATWRSVEVCVEKVWRILLLTQMNEPTTRQVSRIHPKKYPSCCQNERAHSAALHDELLRPIEQR